MTNSRPGRPRVPGAFECPRCGLTAKKHRVQWPEGRICAPCFVRAISTFGTCAQCGRDGMLPGLDDTGTPICRVCARITTDLDCHRCGQEAELIRDKRCARCVLRVDLNVLLSPNDPPDLRLKRLVHVLCDVERPASIGTWVRGDAAAALLTAVGRRELDLEHDAFDALPRSNAIEHLRSLLVAHGMLPSRGDVDLARFDIWVEQRMRDLAEHPRVVAALEPFVRWHHLRRLHDNADQTRNMNYATRSAKQEITEAGKLLLWLDETHAVAFADAEQHQIDEYFSVGTSTRKAARNFVNWHRAIGSGTLKSGRRREAVTSPQATDSERLQQIALLIAADDRPLPPRVAGLLILLFGTPIGRIAQLRKNDVVESPTGMTIQLGAGAPAPIPAAISALVYGLITASQLPKTAGIDAGWLFPGARPGHHAHPDTLRAQLRSLGIAVLPGRNAALADLTQQLHPAVLADTLGYAPKTLTLHAIRGGGSYASYTAHPREPR